MRDARIDDARLLRAVAAVIERDGLSQSGFGGGNEPKCLLGAFGYVMRKRRFEMGIWAVFARGAAIREVGMICSRSGLADMVPRPYRPRSPRDLAVWMARWSDSVGHPSAVVKTLRKCAARLETLADADTAAHDLARAWPSAESPVARSRSLAGGLIS